MKICVVYDRYFEYDGSKVTIGGIQSYISALSKLIKDNENMDVVIYQRAKKHFLRINNDTKVVGVCETEGHLPDFEYLVSEAKRNESLSSTDLIIWATEDISCKVDFCKTLSIQHGISFDVHRPNSRLSSLFRRYFNTDITPLYQLIRYKKALKEIKNSNHIVCVDYNYQNWYRTILPNEPIDCHVIPNFTYIKPKDELDIKINSWDDNKIIKILFARRFFDIRGINLMIELAEKLAKKYDGKVDITFAGEGPRLQDVIKLSNKYKSINITSYKPEASIDFHSQFDIALVPSIGSEGTSLSLLEAMSAGCYCLSSQVGGLTNVIFDGFNGRLLRTKVDDWFFAISNLIESNDYSDIKQQIINGHNVVATSFSQERWSFMWKSLLDSLASDDY
ncbi:glycosyltransferase family 4 protein [Vibrio parahaemolyticus]|uniref:glycosyltransferase family 4 protein n=1 Tax=Vibrio parahaemolyticus TaxID=670 RepID=UPI001FAD2CC0|nr:glycosyltransferase family 4 protein [Vibrio parahaemolyticus]